MKWKIALAVVTFLIIGAPMLVLNLAVLGRAAQFEQAINGETAIPTGIASIGQKIDSMFGDYKDGLEAKALLDPNRMSTHRVVEYKTRVRIEDVLEPGEQMPAPEYHGLYVTARAPQYAMQQECPLILDTFARSCKMVRTEVDDRDDGVYEIKSKLSFLPAAEIGASQSEGNTDMHELVLRFPVDRSTDTTPASQVTERRREIYRLAEEGCAKLREDKGNCVIGNMRITADPVGKDKSDTRVRGYARLNWIGARGEELSMPLLESIEGVDLTMIGQADTGNSIFGRFAGIFSGDNGASEDAGDGPNIIRGGNALRLRKGKRGGKFVAAKTGD